MKGQLVRPNHGESATTTPWGWLGSCKLALNKVNLALASSPQ